MSIYLAVQGMLGLAWWLALWRVPSWRSKFAPEGFDHDFIMLFALPDAVLFVGCAMLGSVLFAVNHRAARPLLLLTTGATLYATLICLGLAFTTTGYWAATIMMLAASFCVSIFALTVRRNEPLLPTVPFATAKQSPRVPVAVRTAIQIFVFWSVLLIMLPLMIAWCERELSIPAGPSNNWVGAAIFAVGGGLGIWSSRWMTRHGRGTPLPIDSALQLVTGGPYAVVRNPMAVGGLMQGLGVAIMLGSWMTLGYVLLGGLIWNACIRPIEEQELCDRFGDEYIEYANRVRCWWPRFG